jgi:hypothetical protein
VCKKLEQKLPNTFSIMLKDLHMYIATRGTKTKNR